MKYIEQSSLWILRRESARVLLLRGAEGVEEVVGRGMAVFDVAEVDGGLDRQAVEIRAA